uniref:Uncharacterized protein n=1 Tax=Ciona savignyi TaxID=51511 RepID=H2YRT6_CIOSA
MERVAVDSRTNLTLRVNSETKMRMEETSGIKQDLARLKMEIQPLLWKQKTEGRTFIKTPSSSLNEWGLYQCARWYDIKMRWLHLLDKSRQRKRSPPQYFPVRHPTPPGSVSPEFVAPGPSARTPGPDPDQTDYSGEDTELENLGDEGNSSIRSASSPVISVGPHDDDDVISDVPDDTEGNMPPDGAINPQPAWYNKDKVDGKSSPTGPKTPRTSHKSATPNSHRSPAQQSPQPSIKTPTGSKTSRRPSNQLSSSGASQGRNSATRAPSTEAPKKRSQQVQPGEGASYDMEGRRN